MGSSVQYGGSWYNSINAAARAAAADMLPDVSVIDASEKAEKAAEAFVWGEAIDSGLGPDVRGESRGVPEYLNESEWRTACRAALVARIEEARARRA